MVVTSGIAAALAAKENRERRHQRERMAMARGIQQAMQAVAEGAGEMSERHREDRMRREDIARAEKMYMMEKAEEQREKQREQMMKAVEQARENRENAFKRMEEVAEKGVDVSGGSIPHIAAIAEKAREERSWERKKDAAKIAADFALKQQRQAAAAKDRAETEKAEKPEADSVTGILKSLLVPEEDVSPTARYGARERMTREKREREYEIEDRQYERKEANRKYLDDFFKEHSISDLVFDGDVHRLRRALKKALELGPEGKEDAEAIGRAILQIEESQNAR